jgi:hypothetical protein
LLRLPPEAELYGMDLHEHGISAYPEYEISPFASPTGLATQSAALERAAAPHAPKAMARASLNKLTT